MYDVLSAWPIMGSGPNMVSPRRAKLAMALRGQNTHYNLHDIHSRHWQTLAKQSGVPDAFEHIEALVMQVPYALAQMADLLPEDFPRAVFNAIRRGMLAQTGKFAAEMA